ncbi:MAG: methyltransferase domain-containing protein [Nitriliruptorales bacterium]|nr:methyltransferase domain-containing protein [Nitriliruptorales bacterium]
MSCGRGISAQPSRDAPTARPERVLLRRPLTYAQPGDMNTPYYRPDLALVHDRGFAFHADGCAPDILTLLEPILQRRGMVLELGCGSGHLTRHLVEAGHRVIATDASLAMLDLTHDHVPGAEAVRQLVLPDDPMPPADAIVSVGHALSYLPTRHAVHHALASAADALNPQGVLALDLCDLSWGAHRSEEATVGRVGDDWAIVTRYLLPKPDVFVRQMAVFLRNDDGSWRRDDERHDNVLVDTSQIPTLLAGHSVQATVGPSFGAYPLPEGLMAVVGQKRPAAAARAPQPLSTGTG